MDLREIIGSMLEDKVKWTSLTSICKGIMIARQWEEITRKREERIHGENEN